MCVCFVMSLCFVCVCFFCTSLCPLCVFVYVRYFVFFVPLCLVCFLLSWMFVSCVLFLSMYRCVVCVFCPLSFFYVSCVCSYVLALCFVVCVFFNVLVSLVLLSPLSLVFLFYVLVSLACVCVLWFFMSRCHHCSIKFWYVYSNYQVISGLRHLECGELQLWTADRSQGSAHLEHCSTCQWMSEGPAVEEIAQILPLHGGIMARRWSG